MRKKIFFVALMTSIVSATMALGAEETPEDPLCEGRILARPATCPVIDAIAVLPLSVRESNVFFPAGGAVLDPMARAQLAKLSRALINPLMAGTCLRLIGHADPLGDADVNLALSRLRAQAVADFLTAELGDSTPPLMVGAKGETELMPDVPKFSLAHRRVALEAKPCNT